MFGLDAIKEIIGKLNLALKMFDEMKKTFEELDQYKKRLELFGYLFAALFGLTLVNTVLITMLLVKK